MPWKVSDVMSQRIEFVIRASTQNVNFSALCREYGISRTTGYLWLQRFHEAGSVFGLQEKSRRPHHSPNRTPPEVEQLVVDTRESNYGYGARKLQVLLADQGQEMPPITIHRVLKRKGLIRPKIAHQPATQRFERSQPNELWQMDFKGPFAQQHKPCYPLSILDDHSRYVVCLQALADMKGPSVHQAIVQTFERYGLPEAMLMDHGTPWWSNTGGRGLTRFSVSLIKQGIRLLWGRVQHPQTQGKVERFHRTLQEAIYYQGLPNQWGDWQHVLDAFRNNYNEIRPHEALGMMPPVKRYTPSSRAYRPHPPEWEYPEGAIVKRLSKHGCLSWKSRYYFVCEALAHEWVQIEPVDNLLLVRYRNMYIRELNQATRSTTAVVLRVED